MGRTINGKPVSEVFKELEKDISEDVIEKRNFDGMEYISVDVFKDRLDEVIGVDHYTEEYSECKIVTLKDTIAVSTMGKLTILDDDYIPFKTVCAPGGASVIFPYIDKKDENGNIIYIEKNGKQVPEKIPGRNTDALANNQMSACQDAFKRMCKKLNIAKNQVAKMNATPEFTITFLQDVTLVEGQHLFPNVTCNGKRIKLAVFKNHVPELLKKFPSKVIARNTSVCVCGNLGKDNRGNEQIVFEKIGKGTPSTSENTASAPAAQNTNGQTGSAAQNQTNQNTTAEKENTYPVVDVTLVTTGVVRPVQDQFAVPVTNKATGEVLKLYFKQEKVENLKKSGFWEILEENASNGVELFVKVEKSGNNLLFLEKNEKAAG